MIKAIHNSGRYIQVIGGSATTYVNANPGAHGVGNLRFNTSAQRLEVYDGSSWQELNMPHVSVGLSADAAEAIDWARQQMEQQKMFERLAKDHPAVADAMEADRQAEERVRIVAALVQE